MSCGNAPEAVAEEGEALMPKRRVFPKSDPNTCARCHTTRAAYNLRMPYCKECFFPAVSQRLTRHLFQPLRPSASRKVASRPPVQSGQVLIAVSGGAGSMTMLDQVMQAGLVGSGDGARADKTKGEKEVIWDRGTLVYVEFSGVTGMADRSRNMEELAEEKGLGYVGVRAEDVYDPNLDRRLRMSRSEGSTSGSSDPSSPSSRTNADNLTRLQSLLASLPPASRPSMLQQILDHLITLTSYSIPNVSHVLSGETSTREAQRVISATATGRGWALPLELSGSFRLHTPEDQSIVRLKPMKEINLKEAAIYCHLRKLRTVNERRWVDARSSGGRGKGSTSLEMLTEQFVLGLSVTHPSTVSTINKTGDKLVFSGNSDSKQLCPLCSMPAEPSAKGWKSRTALTSLHSGEGDRSQSGDLPSTDLDSMLCYACLTTMTGRVDDPDRAELPIWVGERVETRKPMTEIEMRQGIEEFLM